MFHYNNNRNQPRFQTPSIGASRQRTQQHFDSFHPSKGIENRSQNENYHDSYLVNKPSFNTQQINKRSKQRRFGTNLTNKRPLTRINHSNNNNHYAQNKQSQTMQIYKPSKKINFKSRNLHQIQNQNENIMFNKSGFKFNINVGHKLKQNQENDMIEPEYCPKGTSWKPSINKSLQKLIQKAFNVIGEYKLFIPSGKTTEIDYEIQENFDLIQEPIMSNDYLYESDSDDSYNDNDNMPFSFALPPQNCDIPLVKFYIHYNSVM